MVPASTVVVFFPLLHGKKEVAAALEVRVRVLHKRKTQPISFTLHNDRGSTNEVT